MDLVQESDDYCQPEAREWEVRGQVMAWNRQRQGQVTIASGANWHSTLHPNHPHHTMVVAQLERLSNLSGLNVRGGKAPSCYHREAPPLPAKTHPEFQLASLW